MSGESQQLPSSSPDPSVFTTEAIERAVTSERKITTAELDVIRQRLADIDRATAVLNDTVTKTPTEIQTQIAHLKELVKVELQSLKDAAAKQDQVNQKAIDKAETAAKESGTTSTIQLADLKERTGRIEDRKTGGDDVTKGLYLLVGFILSLALAWLAFRDSDSPVSPDPIVVEVPATP